MLIIIIIIIIIIITIIIIIIIIIIINIANYEPPHHALLSPLITSILQNPNISLLRHISNTLYIHFQGSIPFHTHTYTHTHIHTHTATGTVAIWRYTEM